MLYERMVDIGGDKLRVARASESGPTVILEGHHER